MMLAEDFSLIVARYSDGAISLTGWGYFWLLVLILAIWSSGGKK